MRKANRSGILLPVLGAGLFLAFPAAARAGALRGLGLCAEVLVPALLPMSVLTGTLLRMGLAALCEKGLGAWMERWFRLPGAGAAALLSGLAGGFPLGPYALADLVRAGRVSPEEAGTLAPLCSQAGPGFLVGALGAGALGSPALGLGLWGIQLLSAVLTGLLLRPPTPPGGNRPRARGKDPGGQTLGLALPGALGASAQAMVRLTGTVVFFSALQGVLEAVLPLGRLPQSWQILLAGGLELSGTAARLGALERGRAFLLAAALTGWGGVCVHLQAAEALGGTGVRLGPYLLGKLLQSGIAALLAGWFLALRAPTCAGAALPWALLLPAAAGGFPGIKIFKKYHWKTGKDVL